MKPILYDNAQEAYVKAWTEVCKIFADRAASPRQIMDKIEELAILYGDPNAQLPLGVINYREKG